jgi:hypothetical protein
MAIPNVEFDAYADSDVYLALAMAKRNEYRGANSDSDRYSCSSAACARASSTCAGTGSSAVTRRRGRRSPSLILE